MNKREGGSVALAFVGFAVLVLTFKGTWGRAYHALTGSKTPASGGASASAANAGVLAYPVHAGTLAYAGVTSGRPGQAPTPTTQTVAQRSASGPAHPLYSSAHGDRAGAPGENRFTLSSPSDNPYWAFHGGWKGPGIYEAQKFTDPSHGNTTGTELVKVG